MYGLKCVFYFFRGKCEFIGIYYIFFKINVGFNAVILMFSLKSDFSMVFWFKLNFIGVYLNFMWILNICCNKCM